MAQHPLWDDPKTRYVALKLIADTCDAHIAMAAAGLGSVAVLDVLLGNIAHHIATRFPEVTDKETIKRIAWALEGKIRDMRAGLPGYRAIEKAAGITSH